MRRLLAVTVVALVCSQALATPYWVAWEGDDFPENQGWTRNWGNWDGQYQGPGAYRTLVDGILTCDSLYDGGVYDFAHMSRPIDPEPGELFILEWRLKVDQVDGRADPAVYVAGDEGWSVAFEFSETALMSAFEGYDGTPIVPGIFHTYCLATWDMRTYQLDIDGQMARVGSFWHSVGSSEVTWGDGIQSFVGGSLHEWDYFRFGVVPEATPVTLLSVAIACFVGSRR